MKMDPYYQADPGQFVSPPTEVEYPVYRGQGKVSSGGSRKSYGAKNVKTKIYQMDLPMN